MIATSCFVLCTLTNIWKLLLGSIFPLWYSYNYKHEIDLKVTHDEIDDIDKIDQNIKTDTYGCNWCQKMNHTTWVNLHSWHLSYRFHEMNHNLMLRVTWMKWHLWVKMIIIHIYLSIPWALHTYIPHPADLPLQTYFPTCKLTFNNKYLPSNLPLLLFAHIILISRMTLKIICGYVKPLDQSHLVSSQVNEVGIRV